MKFSSFDHFRLSSQFLIASFPVIALCTILVGSWVGYTVKNGVAHRLGGDAALYVDTLLSHRLQFRPGTHDLTPASITALDSFLVDTGLEKKVAALYLWAPAGKLIYSKNKTLLGKSFPVSEGLSDAYAGNIYSEIISPSNNEPENDLRDLGTLIESYAPIRREGTDEILAVAEFFMTTEELNREAEMAELDSWLIVGAVFGAAYVLLFQIVRNGSNMIDAQRASLREKLDLVTALNEQNSVLHDKVKLAAARVTTLNEDFLHRISADLHDGPAQDLGLALMKVETLCDACETCPRKQELQERNDRESPTVRALLKAALGELRTIAAGLQLPDLETLSIRQVVMRSVHDYQIKVHMPVDVVMPEEERDVILPVKITLYRILQESLLNGYRHANGVNQRVELWYDDSCVHVRIADGGMGFDLEAVPEHGHLGIKGMRERVEALGGDFGLHTCPGHGTVIQAGLPFRVRSDEHA
ncbi:sensor histidine kinase [Noviherbaspirillum suwonense]|uniref:Histidine kinase n=1 Tax=Noviherbaspirillum suwonense TaxID=1224511 RepID=A0ABY1QBF7_9BURK|nr:ATP-binding protein [Noviherbaspirillum suwonense]SMP66626.1 hypothetical protein SAMN06295970_11221 [Noviherbaspirillum suwonense]